MLRKLGEKKYECDMWNLEKVIKGEKKKRMEIDEKVNVLVAEIEREKM